MSLVKNRTYANDAKDLNSMFVFSLLTALRGICLAVAKVSLL